MGTENEKLEFIAWLEQEYPDTFKDLVEEYMGYYSEKNWAII